MPKMESPPNSIIRDLGVTVEEEVRERIEEVQGKIQEVPKEEREEKARQLEVEMLDAAQALDFEKAALLRDQVMHLRGEMDESTSNPPLNGRKMRKGR